MNDSIERSVGRILIVFGLTLMLHLLLSFPLTSHTEQTAQAAPLQQLFTVTLNVTKTSSTVSIYKVTNVATFPIDGVNHTFYNAQNQPVHTFFGKTDEILRPGNSQYFDLLNIPAITMPFTGRVELESYGRSITAMLVSSTTPYLNLTKLTSDDRGTAQQFTARTITYTYRVENPSRVDVSSIQVMDDHLGIVGTAAQTLASGQAITFTQATWVATDTTNIATATGSSNFGPAMDSAQAFVIVAQPRPAVNLYKSASATFLNNPPQTVTYTYRVYNVGTVVLSDVVVTDDQFGTIGNTGPLGVNGMQSFTHSASVSGVTNIGQAVATSAYGSVTDTDSVSVVALGGNCGSPTIQSTGDGDWSDPTTWSLNRMPHNSDVVEIQANHTITGLNSTITLSGLCNYGILMSQGSSELRVHAANIDNQGEILGQDGAANYEFSNNPGAPPFNRNWDCGEDGANIELRGRPINNDGLIRAGDGGDGDVCGGHGGMLKIYGQNTINGNNGYMRSGNGGYARGSVTGTVRGYAGDAGDAHVWGKYFNLGGTLENNGVILAGNGGKANRNAIAQKAGGDGGTLKLISLPNVNLNGSHGAGIGGNGAAGGPDGDDGDVFIEPTISLAGPDTTVTGDNITIFGGADFVLQFTGLAHHAIQATNSLTIAVGSQGMVDLRGNNQQIFQAGQQVMIASDLISQNDAVALTTLAGDNVQVMSAQILADFSLVGPGTVETQPGQPITIPLTLLNSGPEQDTFNLSVDLPADWLASDLATLDVAGLELQDTQLMITPSATATETGLVMITAQGQASQQQDMTSVPVNLIPAQEPETDLMITKMVEPMMTVPGETVTYTLSFTNQGPDMATGIMITDMLPAEIANVVSITATGVMVTQTTNTAWMVSDLATGQNGRLILTAMLSDTIDPGLLTNTVMLTSTTVDTNTANNQASATVSITQAMAAPVLTPIGNKTITATQELTFTAVATDPNGDALTFGLMEAPPGAGINGNTGLFSWTPTEEQGSNDYLVTVLVTDTTNLTDSEPITITVTMPQPENVVYLPILLKQ